MTARSLDDWLEFQQSVHPRGIDLTLARVAAVAARLQLLAPAYRVITVAGTNGKGSTVEYCSRMLSASGHRCGAFTSPHLLRYNERIRIDGDEVSDAELVASFEAIEAARGDTTLTFFEYNALAALWLFRERGVAVAVLEVGLGGRLDAVNILDADVAVVASIGFDHRDWLGDTLEAIGREKAGIFRAGRPAVLADAAMTPAVAEVAAQRGSPVLWAGRDYRFDVQDDGRWSLETRSRRWEGLPKPALLGDVQYANAAASIVAVAQLGLAVPDEAIASALRSAQLPGRFQRLAGEVEWILDVAHNVPAAETLRDNLRRLPPASRTLAICGILGDKDIRGITARLAADVDAWILTSLEGARAVSTQHIAEALPPGATVLAHAHDVAEACRVARAAARPGERVLVFGSFLTVGPALEFLGI